MFRRSSPPQKTVSAPSLRRIWVYFVLAICLIIFLAAVIILFIVARIQQKTLQQQAPYTSDQLYSQAVQQVDKGDYATAESYLQQALLKQNDNAYHNQLAVVEYQLKKYPQAIAEYQKLITAKTDVPFAWNGIGNAYRDWAAQAGADKAADESSAIDAYNNALTLDPQYTAAYSNLALLLNSQGKKTEALTVLDKGISLTNQDALKTVRQTVTNQ